MAVEKNGRIPTPNAATCASRAANVHPSVSQVADQATAAFLKALETPGRVEERNGRMTINLIVSFDLQRILPLMPKRENGMHYDGDVSWVLRMGWNKFLTDVERASPLYEVTDTTDRTPSKFEDGTYRGNNWRAASISWPVS